jgi:mRNA-degrading endonuclease toxin of MazEF toxin-antitoxin module
MSYKNGDIVVVRFPFALRNGSEIQKGRPALVISEDKVKRRYNDVILAAITSQVPPMYLCLFVPNSYLFTTAIYLFMDVP